MVQNGRGDIFSPGYDPPAPQKDPKTQKFRKQIQKHRKTSVFETFSKNHKKSQNLTFLMVQKVASRREDSYKKNGISVALQGVEIEPKQCPDPKNMFERATKLNLAEIYLAGAPGKVPRTPKDSFRANKFGAGGKKTAQTIRNLPKLTT